MDELKPGWTRVKFGDVVRLSKERCADPLSAGIDRYIGLEHLEPGDFRVRAWGDVADGTTFTSRVRPGQVLFGKRRAYQRKVAVADFDAVCSGDIYVFESTDPTRLLPELLPFICQTDAFFEHAVGTSAGSLSPRTNWASLAEHSFDLPPISEQRSLANVLASSKAAVQALESVARQAALVSLAFAEERMATAWRTFPRRPLPSLCSVLTVGIVVTPAKYYVNSNGIPVLRSLNVWPERFDLTDLKYISAEGHEFHRKSELRSGDIAIVRTGDPGRPGNAVVVPPEMDGWNCVDLVLARPTEELAPSYLSAFINWSRSARLMQGLSPGTKQKHLSVNNLDRFHVPVPPEKFQEALFEEQSMLSESVIHAQRRLDEARTVHRGLIRRLLERAA